MDKEESESLSSWRQWKPGALHTINRIQWDEHERKAVQSVFDDDWFAQGRANKEFEKSFAEFAGVKYVHGTNSGSAAIQNGLLALEHQGYWKKGDWVIHPVTTFATSISSAMFLGLKPVFVDTKPHTYVADPEQVKRAIKRYPKIRGMILPHLIGSIPDMDAIKDALEDRFLLEDSCDTIGGAFDGKPIGSFGELVAFSFYASHHISTGGVGGAIATNNKSLEYVLKSLTYWGRDFKDGDDEFLKRYNYATLGTDSQMTSIQAAFGLAQLRKLPDFIKARAEQFEEMKETFSTTKNFHLPYKHPKAQPSWFAFPLTLSKKAPFTRAEFARYLTKNGIEVRPLMCGNIVEQPPFRKRNSYVALSNSFPVGNDIEANSLFLPCWGMPREQRNNYYGLLKGFFDRYARV